MNLEYDADESVGNAGLRVVFEKVVERVPRVVGCYEVVGVLSLEHLLDGYDGVVLQCLHHPDFREKAVESVVVLLLKEVLLADTLRRE